MQSEKQIDRREDSYTDIDHLVESRTGALTLYSKLASKQPFNIEQDTQSLLQNFCESLIDYTASAHFQLYRHIDEDRERRQPVREVADEVYPSITSITQKILDFNDKYDCEDHCGDFSTLAEDLSDLGEKLADRIELEDRLIDSLMLPRKAET